MEQHEKDMEVGQCIALRFEMVLVPITDMTNEEEEFLVKRISF